MSGVKVQHKTGGYHFEKKPVKKPKQKKVKAQAQSGESGKTVSSVPKKNPFNKEIKESGAPSNRNWFRRFMDSVRKPFKPQTEAEKQTAFEANLRNYLLKAENALLVGKTKLAEKYYERCAYADGAPQEIKVKAYVGLHKIYLAEGNLFMACKFLSWVCLSGRAPEESWLTPENMLLAAENGIKQLQNAKSETARAELGFSTTEVSILISDASIKLSSLQMARHTYSYSSEEMAIKERIDSARETIESL